MRWVLDICKWILFISRFIYTHSIQWLVGSAYHILSNFIIYYSVKTGKRRQWNVLKIPADRSNRSGIEVWRPKQGLLSRDSGQHNRNLSVWLPSNLLRPRVPRLPKAVSLPHSLLVKHLQHWFPILPASGDIGGSLQPQQWMTNLESQENHFWEKKWKFVQKHGWLHLWRQCYVDKNSSTHSSW